VTVRSRDYAGAADLRGMQKLVSAGWSAYGPLCGTHVGDLPWRMYQHLGKLDEVRIRLWLEADEVVAFGWLWREGSELDFEVHPERPELADDVLEWAGANTAWALDADHKSVAAIERAGYARTEDRWYEHHVRELDRDVEEPPIPSGYRLRTVLDGDVERRVAVHRAAFAPSRVVPESYMRLMQAWPYRRDLDHVVEAADGTFAAFCLCWLDEANAAGLLEPVGTHPDHRRRGLASAVCLAGLRALRAAGARHAVVLSSGRSAATGVYEKIGLRSLARHAAFGRDGGKGTDSAGV
jgi:ribosomal protein S18 acetylase RimI-like enzyme